jgi:hypothetical protein
MAERTPSQIEAELETLGRPSVEVFRIMGVPGSPIHIDRALAPHVPQLRARLEAVEAGVLRMGAGLDPEVCTVGLLRRNIQGALVYSVGRRPQQILDLPAERDPATRLFLELIPDCDADRLLTASLAIILAHRLERAEARIAELEIDLAAVRSDAPEVEL